MRSNLRQTHQLPLAVPVLCGLQLVYGPQRLRLLWRMLQLQQAARRQQWRQRR